MFHRARRHREIGIQALQRVGLLEKAGESIAVPSARLDQ
jgi:hypothetical protein